jgi:4a-hydroxytetrahydrobiopterin dehydratase
MTDLASRRCAAKVDALDARAADALLPQVPGWTIVDGKLVKTFAFQDYHRTMAFVNAVAWIAHREDHHPAMTVSYNRCRIEFDTHSVAGLSLNDFICAARVEALDAQ